MGAFGVKLHKLVLLRHGESTWNRENRFTGWTDVPLSEKGTEEAIEAGRALKEKGFKFDLAYCSVLKRAVDTLKLTLKEMGQEDIPIKYSWRLNERHYGALQGLNKAEMAKIHGEEQVYIWRRSYDIRPPALETSDKNHPLNDPLYKDVDRKLIPAVECLKDTVERFLPYWNGEIAPEIRKEKRILISAHGNSLRALLKHLDNVSDTEIPLLNIPTGIPLIYELDEGLRPIRHYYLADEEKLRVEMDKVAKQGKAK